ncbi:ZG49 protein, partial [Pluvianellus socialis]|nr:ZG49 protein [Pluvianellus socialis]
TFTQKQALTVHQRVHVGERPSSCARCPKTFTQKRALTVHQCVHTGQKPYKCGQCGQ